jgi:hypothetical protein
LAHQRAFSCTKRQQGGGWYTRGCFPVRNGSKAEVGTPEGVFLKENTVFLIATAILKNFFLHLLDVIGGRVKGLDRTARLKRFLRMFVVVPAKWIKSGRRNVLNLYTKRRIFLELVR